MGVPYNELQYCILFLVCHVHQKAENHWPNGYYTYRQE